ncbi:MAG TPA: hypothetical protein VFG19_06945 [Geobacteraceae bacterium]|nr:hypothetical protein [Geobacteraceae bacterium]
MLFAPEFRNERLKMIEQAFKVKAPKVYKVLKASGNLGRFLESHEEAMMDSFSKAYGEASMKILRKNLDYEKTVLSLRMASNELWHDTLDMWLAFNYPETKTSA